MHTLCGKTGAPQLLQVTVCTAVNLELADLLRSRLDLVCFLFGLGILFPHFTTFLGDLRPVQSNEILENLFGEKMPLNNEYNEILDGKVNEVIKKTKVKIEEEEFDAFVHLNGKNENLNGTMKSYYF